MKHLINYLNYRIDMRKRLADGCRTQAAGAEGEELAELAEGSAVHDAAIEAFQDALEIAMRLQAETASAFRDLAQAHRESARTMCGGSRYLEGCADGMEDAAFYVETGSFIKKNAAHPNGADGDATELIPSLPQAAASAQGGDL